MDYRMTPEDMEEETNIFGQATKAFFKEVGIDTVLYRGKDFSAGSSDRTDFMLATQNIIFNLKEAQNEVQDMDTDID